MKSLCSPLSPRHVRVGRHLVEAFDNPHESLELFLASCHPQAACGTVVSSLSSESNGLLAEQWVSGLNQQFAKLSYGVNPYRGFKSLLLRQISNSDIQMTDTR